tara:strand:+ start:592 stop:1110 length:519 start_codon:yes stop_codon:yes gene_type:complete
MLFSIFGNLSLLCGLLILVLPLMLAELSRPRDWLMGGLFLFLGLFLLVEHDFLDSSINLLVISIAILLGKMISEITQTRWYQLSVEEKKRIGSFERWFESFSQLGQIFAQLGNSLLGIFKKFNNKSKKSVKDKKWVHPELKEEISKKANDQSALNNSKKISKAELTENDETS